jgi:hypothetical protein
MGRNVIKVSGMFYSAMKAAGTNVTTIHSFMRLCVHRWRSRACTRRPK